MPIENKNHVHRKDKRGEIKKKRREKGNGLRRWLTGGNRGKHKNKTRNCRKKKKESRSKS